MSSNWLSNEEISGKAAFVLHIFQIAQNDEVQKSCFWHVQTMAEMFKRIIRYDSLLYKEISIIKIMVLTGGIRKKSLKS